jgi:hypothetical protein
VASRIVARLTERRILVVLCVAQATAQSGTFAVPALLPTLIDIWSLRNTEARWITGICYAGYTLSVKIYIASTALTPAANLGYALVADGFWSALLVRALRLRVRDIYECTRKRLTFASSSAAALAVHVLPVEILEALRLLLQEAYPMQIVDERHRS